jgi:hypothetical protein
MDQYQFVKSKLATIKKRLIWCREKTNIVGDPEP